MDATERLEDHQTCALNELIEVSVDEEVIDDDILAFVQLQSSAFEIKVDVQVLQELGDGVFVGVRFLLDDLDQIFQGVAAPAVDDDGDRQVAQNVRTSRLDDVQVHRLVQQHLDDEVASLRVMEEHQHAPVDEPGALCQELHVTEGAVVDVFAQTIQVLQCRLPVQRENLGGQLAPQHVQVVLVVGRHDHQANVQVRGGLGVVSAVIPIKNHSSIRNKTHRKFKMQDLHVLSELIHALNDVDVDLKAEHWIRNVHWKGY